MLRAGTLADKFVSAHQKQDAERLLATQERDKIYSGLAALNVSAADRLVVWNCHNTSSNDRGTARINVLLLLRGTVGWSKSGLPIDWNPGKDTSLTIPLPKIPFDKIRIEVVEWHKLGGGLSEIQVFRGETNIAQGAPVAVSGMYDKRFPASRLTDGITTSAEDAKGYWLLPNAAPGWAEIDISGRKGD
jgi:hypothetical protein